jgi:hypothetical protein
MAEIECKGMFRYSTLFLSFQIIHLFFFCALYARMSWPTSLKEESELPAYVAY